MTDTSSLEAAAEAAAPAATLEDAVREFEQSAAAPRNWSRRRKWTAILVLAAMTFVVCLTPAVFAPALGQVEREFGIDDANLAALVISIYVLGWASGPLVVSPLSELYGRLWVYHVSNTLFVVFTVLCAVSRSLAQLIAFRFLAGCMGSAVVNIGGASVADLFVQDQRGAAMTVWTVGALLGPIFGPIIGGFLAQAAGWRWTVGLIAIAAAVTLIPFFVFMRETYAPVLIARQQRCRDSTQASLPARTKFAQALRRPVAMLLFSPVVCVACVYIAVVFGYVYLLITTIPSVFTTVYGFSTSATGLVYLGLGVGMLASVILFGFCSDRLLRYLAARSASGVLQPEHRLPPLVPACVIIPLGLLLYGWAAQARLHWMAPIIGTALVGVGFNTVLMCLQTYLVDAYPLFAASALAAITIARSLVGALLPLAGPAMYARLGLGWGSTLLAVIALLFLPLPFVLMTYGERWRARSRFNEKG